jgi:hypothetical protein
MGFTNFYSSLLLIISSHTLALPKISDIPGIQGYKWKKTPVLEHYVKKLCTCCVLSQQVHFSQEYEKEWAQLLF